MRIKKSVITIIIGIEAVIIAAVIIFLFYINSDTVKINRQLELAQRYLLEEDYEQAIAAFEIVIEIDPKNVDAYLGLAEAYVSTDKLEDAVRTLEKAAGQTDSDEILELLEVQTDKIEQKQLAAQKAAEAAAAQSQAEAAEMDTIGADEGTEVTLQPETTETIADQEMQAIEVYLQEEEPDMYDDLVPFLVNFVFGYSYMSTGTGLDYDCSTASSSGLLEAMVREGSCFISGWYPYNTGEYQWLASDPLGKWDAYCSVSAQQIDWCLKNIFNCSDEDIVSMKSNLLLDNNDSLYLYDGYYYYPIGGIGSLMDGYIESVVKTGNKYNVKWVLTDNGEIMDYYNAVVEVKIIDGSKYWSLYSNKSLN